MIFATINPTSGEKAREETARRKKVSIRLVGTCVTSRDKCFSSSGIRTRRKQIYLDATRGKLFDQVFPIKYEMKTCDDCSNDVAIAGEE